MKIVAVTSCATGIAHSYMAAEALKKAGKKAGHSVRVEIQGAMGLEDTLSQAEIDGADVVVLANDVGLSQAERFERSKSKTVRVKPHEVIKRPDELLGQIQELVNREGGTTS